MISLLVRMAFCCIKKNDVAKMRQAGTAPATGMTVYCLSSLWCAVTYKRCSAMCYHQHTSASECASRTWIRPMSCRIYCAIYLAMLHLEFGVSEHSK